MRAMGWNPHTVRNVWQKCGVRVKEIECYEIKDGLLVGVIGTSPASSAANLAGLWRYAFRVPVHGVANPPCSPE